MSMIRQVWAADNLEALAVLEARSVTLAYLDPPFNSGRSYDALLGTTSRSAPRAFDDAWTWGPEAEDGLAHLEEFVPGPAASVVRSMVETLGRGDVAAYLVMMTPRLGEISRVLALDGSLYLHCDPAASHYLKVVLDHIFGPENFRNEIIWKRTHAHSSSRRFGPVHDVLLFYTKSANYVWNQGFAPYSQDYIGRYFREVDERGPYQLITCTAPGPRPGTRAHYLWRGHWPPAGRHWAWTEVRMEELEAEGRLVYSANGTPRMKRYVDDGEGVRLQDLWLDINPLGAHAAERTGFETQKPLALVERILRASSNPGDLIIDPFAGTGTAAVAAERLGRSWIAVDSSLLAAALTLGRIRFTGADEAVRLHGFPRTESAARRLQRYDSTTFAVWGTGMLGTLLDKRTVSEALASGTSALGQGKAGGRLVSWVPLRTDGDVPSSTPVSRNGADRGVVLITNPTTLELHSWLESQTRLPVHRVALDACVSADAVRLGIAPVLARSA